MGASVIRFEDATDGSRYLYTLLVPADANQLFPAFDQPDLKGRFRVEITAPLHYPLVPLPEELSTRIRGRDLLSGLPRELELDSEEVRRAIDPPLADIMAALAGTRASSAGIRA